MNSYKCLWVLLMMFTSYSIAGEIYAEFPDHIKADEKYVFYSLDFPDFARHSEELKCNSKRGCYEQGQTIHTAVQRRGRQADC